MAAELRTGLAWYGHRHAGLRRPLPSALWPKAFRQFHDGVVSLVTSGTAAQAELQQNEDEALASAMRARASEIAQRARETFDAISAAAVVLRPLAEARDVLPVDSVRALNEAIVASERRNGASKSDAIPEKLLSAAHGSKLYENLVQKVATVCRRDFAETERREFDTCSAKLMAGGEDKALDARRAALADALAFAKRQLWAEHADALSQSDHIPIREAVPLGGDRGDLTVVSWNVMEFPRAGAAAPVMHGVTTACTEVLHYLGQTGAQERFLLFDAMCSDAVIERHAQRVLSFIRESIESGADVVLLQELCSDLQLRVAECCKQQGWACHFSAANKDAEKIDAITAIVSSASFDEVTELEVQREGKARRFAAARLGDAWVISCHLPLVNTWSSKKQPEVSGEVYGVQVLEQLWSNFGIGDTCANSGNHQRCNMIVAGGDWNANLREIRRMAGDTLELAKHAGLSLYSPATSTCLTRYTKGAALSPIDGVLRLEACRQ